MSAVSELLSELIACPSVTPNDAGCQNIIANRLVKIGFEIEWMNNNGVTNLWATRKNGYPWICIAGHTDVVPAGNLEAWKTPPFVPTEIDGYLYGRGTSDMKGGVAAATVAVERVFQKYPDIQGTISVLLTSDEEALAVDGTAHVIEILKNRNIQIDHCLLAEPTCEKVFGDMLKNGRRGSLNAHLTVYGVQGHVAYAQFAKNPIFLIAPLIEKWRQTEWDERDENFPPTTFQISNISAGVGASNVIPGELHMRFNFRFSPAVSVEELQKRIKNSLDEAEISYKIDWEVPDKPFLSPEGKWTKLLTQVIEEVVGIKPGQSTDGGTSDGRFLIDISKEVVEFGPMNETIHQANENINLKNLDQLAEIYEKSLEALLLKQKNN